MIRPAVGLLLLSLAACGSETADTPAAPTNPSTTPAASKRLLVVTHTEGYRHSSIPVAEAVLGELALESGRFTVAYCRNADDVRSMLTPSGLSGFDGVFFANTTGELGIPDLDAFLNWVRQGHGFLGAHSASDTYHGQPAFIDMLGGEFRTHGNQTEETLRIEKGGHPAVAHFGATFRVYDEMYEFAENPRPRVNVLLSLDHHPNDGHPQAGQPGDFVIAWHRDYGQGRVFYTALGHREDVWQSPLFRQHLAGAIRWALRD